MALDHDVQKVIVVDGEALDPFVGSVKMALYNKDGSVITFGNDMVELVGPEGPMGPPGPPGETGLQGPRGFVGIQGEQGLKGDTGDPGAAGANGLQGPKGDTGDPGAPGQMGPAGAPGAQGNQGPIGPPGQQGPAGSQGLPGVQGPQGVQGPSGNIELDYAQITANVVQANTANSEFDIPGLAINPVVAGRPITIEVAVQMITHTVAGAVAVLKIFEDGVQIASANQYLSSANNGSSQRVKVRRSPSAGAHAYKARLFVTSAGTYTVYAATNSPGFIEALER